MTARYPLLDAVAAMSAEQLQRAETNRHRTNACPACGGTGDIKVAVVDFTGVTYEIAVCGDCSGTGVA